MIMIIMHGSDNDDDDDDDNDDDSVLMKSLCDFVRGIHRSQNHEAKGK